MRPWGVGLGVVLVGCTSPTPPPSLHDPCGGAAFAGVVARGTVVWVDAARGDDGARGDAAAPVATLAEALRRAPDGTVLLLPGRYAGGVTLGAGNAGLTLAGACSEAVELDGRGLERGLSVEAAPEVPFELSGFSVVGAEVGVMVAAGRVTARDVAIREHRKVGWWAAGSAAGAAELVGSELRVGPATDPEVESDLGYGVVVGGGGALDVSGLEVEGVRGYGVLVAYSDPAQASPLHLDRVSVDGVTAPPTRPETEPVNGLAFISVPAVSLSDISVRRTDGDGIHVTALASARSVVTAEGVSVVGSLGPVGGATPGYGLNLGGAVEMDCVSCELRWNTRAGVSAGDGAALTLRGASSVRGTYGDPAGGTGAGIWLHRASLRAEGLVVDGNAAAGILASDGALLDLDRVTVSNSQPFASAEGSGVFVLGSSLVCRSCTVRDNHAAGVVLANGDDGTPSDGHLSGASLVEGTVPRRAGEDAVGILVVGGSELTATGLEVRDVAGAGLFVYGKGSRVLGADLWIHGVHGGAVSPWGVAVADGAELDLGGLHLAEVDGYGLLAQSGARVQLRDAFFEDLGAPTSVEDFTVGALHVDGASEVDADALLIRGATGRGVVVRGGSRLGASDLLVEELQPGPGDATDAVGWTAAVGVEVSGGSRAELLRPVLLAPPGVGVFLTDGGSASLVDAHIALARHPDPSHAAYGVVAVSESLVEVDGACVEGVWGTGVWLTDSRLDGAGLSLLDQHPDAGGVGLGLVLAGHSVAELEGLEVVGTRGPGVSLFAGARLDCTDCEVRQNRYAGVQARDAELNLVGGVIEGTAPDSSGIGGGVGLLFADTGGASVLELDGTRVGPHTLAGVMVSGDGAFRIVGAELLVEEPGAGEVGPWGQALLAWGWPGLGVASPRAWDGVRGLSVTDTVLSGPHPEALLLFYAGAELCGLDLVEGAGGVSTPGAAGLAGCDADTLGVSEEPHLFEPVYPRTDYEQPLGQEADTGTTPE